MAEAIADTRRLYTKPQNLNDAYGPPNNFLEIDVNNPETVGVGRNRFTTYEIRLKVSSQCWPDQTSHAWTLDLFLLKLKYTAIKTSANGIDHSVVKLTLANNASRYNFVKLDGLINISITV